MIKVNPEVKQALKEQKIPFELKTSKKKIDTSKWTVKLTSRFDSHDENYNDIVCEYENEI